MITIGRSSRCTISVDQRYDTVSNEHANIDQQGNALVYYDHSSNGTVINGQKIHNDHVNIYPGDKILLAGVYELTWQQIGTFFPSVNRPTVESNIRGGGYDSGRRTMPINSMQNTPGGHRVARPTDRFNGNQPPYQGGYAGGQNYADTPNYVPNPQQPVQNQYGGNQQPGQNQYGKFDRLGSQVERVPVSYSQAEIDQATKKWNWGAFFCSWIWAACHRTYWPLFILLAIFVPYIGQICALCLSVYLGMNGSRIAWECGKYRDFESYKRAQHNWAVGGLIWFLISVASTAYITYNTLMLF